MNRYAHALQRQFLFGGEDGCISRNSGSQNPPGPGSVFTVSDCIGPSNDPDRYELVELTSRGSEGELWRGALAVDGQLLPVAIKILHSTSNQAFAEAAARWQQQAELLRSLEHGSLVKVRDVFEGPAPHAAGASDAQTRGLFLIMNWAAGESLPVWCATHPDRDALDATRIITRVAGAVDYLHSGKATAGVAVFHQDIKPANVIVDGADVRLVDFGFARLAGDRMTIAGTPSYLAPEIVAGAQPSEASDRYSLGATAYYVLTGEDPTPNDIGAMKSRLMQVRGLEGREDIADHLLTMMARDPSRRPTNIIEWSQSLAVGTVSERIPTSAPTQSMAAVPVGDIAPSRRGPKRSRRMLIAILAAVIALGAAGAGVALTAGSGSANKSSKPSGAVTTKKRISMPDVIGLPLAHARSQLRRAGITDITVVEEASSQTAGTVLSTDPSSGARVNGGVTVTVGKKPTNMPDVTGKSLSDATTNLEGLGLTVKPIDVLDDTKADGTVLTQEPTAGSPIGREATLKVARRSVSTFLADLQPVSGYRSTAPATVSGIPYAHSVQLGASSSGESVEYDLGRHYRRLQATIGLRDDSGSSDQVKIEVFGDGRSLFSQVMAIGQAAPLDVDVTGVLRLKLSATRVSTACCAGTSAVWGDIRALGAPSEVPGFGTSTTSTP